MPRAQSCTNYSSRDAFRNSVLAGMAGAAGAGIATIVLGKTAVDQGLKKGCQVWSENRTNYYDWLYPLEYYETVKGLIMNLLKRSAEDFEEKQIIKNYEKALYSVPVYDGIFWGPSKVVNRSGQVCDLPSYNLKHNLIEIHQGNADSMGNLKNPIFKPLNETVKKILRGKINVKLPKKFEKNVRFGAAGSILPYAGTGIGIGGAYAQPSFGFGGAGSILPYAGTDGIGGAYAQPSFGFGKKKRKRKRKVVKRKRKTTKKCKTVKRKRKVVKRKTVKSKGKIQLKSIKKSTKAEKKFMATFIMPNGRTKTTHFGAAGMSDYTKHKDPARKQRYINRHKKRENWNDPTTAGALSLYILWNKPTLKASIADYKKRFGFK